MKRQYEIDAPLARALDLLGERWTLLIIRQLFSGEQRFSDLYSALYGISSNLLSMRLRDLVQAGIITRMRSHGGAQRCGAQRYRLTPRGQALAPVVWSLNAWAQTHLDMAAPNEPRHQRCREPLTQQWYCPCCRRPVEETELAPPPTLE